MLDSETCKRENIKWKGEERGWGEFEGRGEIDFDPRRALI